MSKTSIFHEKSTFFTKNHCFSWFWHQFVSKIDIFDKNHQFLTFLSFFIDFSRFFTTHHRLTYKISRIDDVKINIFYKKSHFFQKFQFFIMKNRKYWNPASFNFHAKIVTFSIFWKNRNFQKMYILRYKQYFFNINEKILYFFNFYWKTRFSNRLYLRPEPILTPLDPPQTTPVYHFWHIFMILTPTPCQTWHGHWQNCLYLRIYEFSSVFVKNSHFLTKNP